jgi:hypothetical protein
VFLPEALHPNQDVLVEADKIFQKQGIQEAVDKAMEKQRHHEIVKAMEEDHLQDPDSVVQDADLYHPWHWKQKYKAGVQAEAEEMRAAEAANEDSAEVEIPGVQQEQVQRELQRILKDKERVQVEAQSNHEEDIVAVPEELGTDS